MAQWCFYPVATALTGKIELKRPYPRDTWTEDVRWNAYLFQAMHHVLAAERVFSKPAHEWRDAENKFYRDMLLGLQGEP